MKNKLIQVVLASAGLTFFQGAVAGQFSVSCSYENDNIQECAQVVSDIITDKFTAKFPATKYQIFVHSNIHSYTNGGYAAYAVTGVIPKGSDQFPARYFATTRTNRTDERFTTVQLAEQELENYRSAVKELMEKCEISPTCDVYNQRKK